MDASAGGGVGKKKRERKQTVFTIPFLGFYELKTKNTVKSTGKGSEKGSEKGKVNAGSGGSRSNTSANFFEFWVLCYILCVVKNGSKPTTANVSTMMDDVSDAIQKWGNPTEISFQGIKIYFPNKEKIVSFMQDWEKKKNSLKVKVFVKYWCIHPTGLYEIVYSQIGNVKALYIACHPPDVDEILNQLEDPKGKNATADVTILRNDGDIFGISVKQSKDPETISTTLPFANLSASIVFERAGLPGASNDLLKNVEAITDAWREKNKGKPLRYAREDFVNLDKESKTDPKSPFAVITKALSPENAIDIQSFLSEILTIWNQQLYPGTLVCVGARPCITHINNVTQYQEHAGLFTSQSLYIGRNAAKLFYLVFSPYYDNTTGKHKYDIILIECGRRGSPNYKFILSYMYSDYICFSLPMEGRKGIPADACEFFNYLIEKFKKDLNINCGGTKRKNDEVYNSGKMSDHEKSENKGRESKGGTRKCKSLRRRNTRRSSKN